MNKEEVTRLAKVEQKVDDAMSMIKANTQEQRQDFDRIFEKLDNLDNQFASKWVEKLVIGILISIIAAIGIGIIALI